jgi:hypothetical protein
MSPARVPHWGAALACAFVLALPTSISDATQASRPGSLDVRPLTPSVEGLSGLSPDWSPARHVVLLNQGIAAGDRIAELPYRYGGGHGSFVDTGYDCSGSVSYVLHAMDRLDVPADSTDLMSYGEPGPGEYVTVYANPSHAYMVIDGRRFDTSGREANGTRWQPSARSSAGYVARHPAGL